MGWFRKPVGPQGPRGFESPPLRHVLRAPRRACAARAAAVGILPRMLGEEARRLVAFVILCACAGAASAQEAPAKEIAGRVLDENGKPIAGAAIALLGSRDFADTAQLIAAPPIASAADGTFAVTFASDRTRLLVAAAGRQSCEQTIAAGAVLGD